MEKNENLNKIEKPTLNDIFSTKKKILARHNTFLISDKLNMLNVPKNKPFIKIDDFYELKNTNFKTITSPIMPNFYGSPIFPQSAQSKKLLTGRNSLNNLLKIDENNRNQNNKKMRIKQPLSNNYLKPTFQSTSNLIHNLNIYSELKTKESVFFEKKKKKKSIKEDQKQKKNRFYTHLETEYYNLQKTAIEDYLKGEKINNNLIEMDYYSYLKYKRDQIKEIISEKEVKRIITPIKNIISPKNDIKFNLQKTKNEIELKKINMLNKLISEQIDSFNQLGLNKLKNIENKMQIYNRYYMNFLINPKEYFLQNKDLTINNLSLSKDMISKLKNANSQENPKKFLRFESKRVLKTKTTKTPETSSLNSSFYSAKDEIDQQNNQNIFFNKIVEQTKAADMERNALISYREKIEKIDILTKIERDFLKAVKSGDLEMVKFHLIDNKNLLNAKDKVYLFFFLINIIFSFNKLLCIGQQKEVMNS